MNSAVVSKLRTRLVNLLPAGLVDGAARRVWPPVCLVCGLGSDTGEDCCAGCRDDLPVPAGRCRRCSAVLVRDVERCGACQTAPPAFDRAVAAFEYAAPVAHLIRRFKFNGDLAAGRVLARLAAERLARCAARRPQVMAPVPLNWRRHWQRGFNQAELLGRDFARHFGGLPWAPVLVRTRPTATQSDLPARRRAGNVRGAFGVARLPAGAKHVVLVDDVMTTGATLSECARVLKRAGVTRVDAWVVARA